MNMSVAFPLTPLERADRFSRKPVVVSSLRRTVGEDGRKERRAEDTASMVKVHDVSGAASHLRSHAWVLLHKP